MSKFSTLPVAPESRFWDHVNVNGPIIREELGQCWEWTGRLNRGGYGQFRWNQQQVTGAHQAAWRLSDGDIPEGLCVLHKCDNRRCVRRLHLWLGTKRDNNRDRDIKGRARGPRGEQCHLAKLTSLQVLEIRRRRSGGISAKLLAHEFMVDRTLIWMIVTRRIWSHV